MKTLTQNFSNPTFFCARNNILGYALRTLPDTIHVNIKADLYDADLFYMHIILSDTSHHSSLRPFCETAVKTTFAAKPIGLESGSMRFSSMH